MMARALSLILVGLVSSAIAQTSISVPSIVKTDRPFVVEHASGAEVQAIFAVAGADGITWQSLSDEGNRGRRCRCAGRLEVAESRGSRRCDRHW